MVSWVFRINDNPERFLCGVTDGSLKGPSKIGLTCGDRNKALRFRNREEAESFIKKNDMDYSYLNNLVQIMI